jgi:uncharacterized membrane protein
MIDYILKAALTWLLGFAPTLEVYVAIPAGMAMGIGTQSAIFWGTFGNLAAVPVVLVFFRAIARIPLMRTLMEKRLSESNQRRLNRWGPWFVLFMTPVTGVWVVVIAARAAQMNPVMIVVCSFISVIACGLAVGGVVDFLWNWWRG